MSILRGDCYLNVLYYTRLAAVVTSLIIVIGSIGHHGLYSGPLDVSQLGSNDIQQRVTDRRLISTLVASQASIFCPLFILVAKITVEITDSIIEMACQFLMPIGLAICWIFSILFDLKSTQIISLCSSGFLFVLLHALKYVAIGLFTLEPILIGIVCYKNYHAKRIQLHDDEKL